MDKFDKKGWEILDFNLDDDSISKILNDCDGKYSYGKVHENENNRIFNAWRSSDDVRLLATNDVILKHVEERLGGSSFPFQTLNFCKGTQQPLHSDFYHFASRNHSGMCGVWVALEDTNEKNGALSVLTGSHKNSYLFPEDLDIPVGRKNNPYEHYKQYEDAIQQFASSSELELETLFLKKGQAVIWHSNLIHGGSPISDPNSTRFSQVTHYFRTGSAYYSPITSGKSAFSKSYRIPFNISTGRRAYSALNPLDYGLDILGF